MRRTIRSIELVSFYGDKKSHSRCSYLVGFFFRKRFMTRIPQLSAVYLQVLRKIVHAFSLDAPLPDQYGINKIV